MFFSPFSVYLLTKYMRRIPASIIDAAKIDGAREWQIFTKVCAPICRNMVCAVAILVFMDYWNMVEQPLILLKDEALHPLSVFLSKINEAEVGWRLRWRRSTWCLHCYCSSTGRNIWWKESLIREESRDERDE